MAQAKDAHHAFVFQVQQKILTKLCIAYRHSHKDPASSMLAENIKRELAIPEAIWNEVLDGFVDAGGERIVEVFERNGERYLKLGETAQSNLSEWPERTNDDRRRYVEAVSRNQRRINPALLMVK